jgi:hypothetical protein
MTDKNLLERGTGDGENQRDKMSNRGKRKARKGITNRDFASGRSGLALSCCRAAGLLQPVLSDAFILVQLLVLVVSIL